VTAKPLNSTHLAAPTALLVAVGLSGQKRDTASLDELFALVESAGMQPVGRMACQRPRPDPAYFVGDGKAQEIADLIAEQSIHTVVFDHGLSPTQHRNLERRWGVEVVDRPDLILEIFAGRARSHEGKLQVEVARLEHLTSRIVRGWSHLERQKGGIGLRGGPGEKQLELDRRMLEDRLKKLKIKLAAVVRQRNTQRRSRARNKVFTVALVGYTNAGKSTLFNALTRADTYAADQLFATLDTLTRRVRLPGSGIELALSDTVGFIRDLPHQLVAAFRATLDETAQADLLLHVVDGSAPNREEQILDVEKVLTDINAMQVPCIQVFNKVDASGTEPRVDYDEQGLVSRVFLSAQTGAGLELLRQALAQRVESQQQEGDSVGYDRGYSHYADSSETISNPVSN
jgi:GTPase